jgi:acyl-CoA synthetase (AMP-forming)/AMP-acid ligase II
VTEPEHGTPEYWVRTRPDTPAVIKGHEVLTYGEWNERGDRVAEGLAAQAAAVVFVDELPVNPTGKVLKTELRAPYWEGRDRRV